MFEKLKELGEAFKTFGKNDEVEVDEKTSIEKLDEFNQANDIFSATQSEESKDIESIDDTSKTETSKDIINKEDKEDKEKKEDSLEKKLKNIEKVIETFSGAGEAEIIPTKDMYATSGNNINPKALDMGSVQAKELITEYLKPSVNSDRVGLLYENLRKLNLI